MSVQASGWVIQHSRHKGANLLCLLMIANHAHADGTGAYPSIETLAGECRMSERQIRRILALLEQSGELTIERDAGPRGVSLYSLPLVAQPDKMSTRLPDKMSAQPVQPTGHLVQSPTGHLVTATGHFDTPLPDISSSSGAIPPRPPYMEELIKVNRPFNRQRERACAPAREAFSPAHPSLSEEQYGEAEAMGLTREQAETATAQWADRRIERGASSDDWTRNHRTFLRAYVEKLPGIARASPNDRAPTAGSMAPVIVPEDELTPAERAWRGASEEERAMGQRAFTARFNAQHRDGGE
jgi:hypothetical protein